MAFPDVPGYGFYPTDDEILRYLRQRVIDHIDGRPNSMSSFFPDIDLRQFKPWEIPSRIESSTLGNSNRDKWYFFCPRTERHNRTVNRTVPEIGSWNVTGRNRDVKSATSGEVIGSKTILVLRRSGRGSSGNGHGSWTIHEYHLSPSYLDHDNITKMPFVACCLMNN